MRAHDLLRLDARPVPHHAGEIRAFLCVRNEIGRLPWALSYHRSLGVDRFFIIDNGSTDGTAGFVLQQPDAHLFDASGAYDTARNGIDWLECLLQVYGLGRWCLLIDADEQLVYPGSDSVGLASFCRSLSEAGHDCLPTQFVDLYSDQPILETHVDPHLPPLATCAYFDASGYYDFPVRTSSFPRRYGGARARLFWPEVDLAARASSSDVHMAAAFDEDQYLSRHSDVAEAVRQGRLTSGLEHFTRYGHLERRAVQVRDVAEWPEDVYLAAHPDVRADIRSGLLLSGLDHYVRFGYFEGRPTWACAPPCLTQVPLIYWRDGCSLEVGRHGLSGSVEAGQRQVGGALLHFRLVDSIVARTADVAQQALETAWSKENRRYREMLDTHPSLSCLGPVSVRYTGPQQLVDLGIVFPLVGAT